MDHGDGLPATAEALVPVCHGCARVLIIAGDDDAAAVALLAEAVDLRRAQVQVAAVASVSPATLLFAPMTGLVCREEIRKEAVARAECAARDLARRIPAAVVTHRVLRGWDAVPDLLGTGAFDVLALARRPGPRRLRGLAETTARVGAAMVITPSERKSNV